MGSKSADRVLCLQDLILEVEAEIPNSLVRHLVCYPHRKGGVMAVIEEIGGPPLHGAPQLHSSGSWHREQWTCSGPVTLVA